jgi:hypothetical protein
VQVSKVNPFSIDIKKGRFSAAFLLVIKPFQMTP